MDRNFHDLMIVLAAFAIPMITAMYVVSPIISDKVWNKFRPPESEGDYTFIESRQQYVVRAIKVILVSTGMVTITPALGVIIGGIIITSPWFPTGALSILFR